MTKTKSTNPEIGEDDSRSPKSYCKGESSKRMVEVSISNTNRPIKPIEEIEPTKSAPMRSGQVRRLIEFYQLGFDYVNYMDVGRPSFYEEAIARSDANTWLQAMYSEMNSI